MARFLLLGIFCQHLFYQGGEFFFICIVQSIPVKTSNATCCESTIAYYSYQL